MSQDTVNQNDLYLMLGRLEGKVDTILSTQTSHVVRMDKIEDQTKDHESRLTKIETGKEAAKAHVAMVVSVLSALLSGSVGLFGLLKEWLLK